MLRVTQQDRNTYLVESETSDDPHLVDFEANGGRGACDCGQFTYRINPQWKKGEDVRPCKHIWAAYAERYWQIVKHA